MTDKTELAKIDRINKTIGLSYTNDWTEYIEKDWHRHLTQTQEEHIGYYPIMIWDVLEWIEKEKKITDLDFELHLSNIYNTYQKKREPIENQSKDCIDYIYNLIK